MPRSSHRLAVSSSTPPPNPLLTIDPDAHVPNNSIYHQFRPDSTPKRAIREEHDAVLTRIRSLTDGYADYAGGGGGPPQSSKSKYQLESLFDDFEAMAGNSNEALVAVHENVDLCPQVVEGDVGGGAVARGVKAVHVGDDLRQLLLEVRLLKKGKEHQPTIRPVALKHLLVLVALQVIHLALELFDLGAQRSDELR